MKTFIRLIIPSVAVVVFISGCTSYKNSNKFKNEKLVTVVKDTSPVIDNSKLMALKRGASSGSFDIADRAIGYAASGINKLIVLSKKNLTVEYSTGLNNLYFYNNFSKNIIDPIGMQFNGFSLSRTVDVNENTEKALYVSFSVDTTDKEEIMNNSIFHLKLDDIELNYSKARIPTFKWYLPWTIFWASEKYKKLNMDIEISLTSSWIDQDYTIHKDVEIGNFTLCLRDMPLDKNDTAYTRYYSDLKGTKLSGYSFIAPRSYGCYLDAYKMINEGYGQGVFNITVNVKEAGKEKFINKIADNSKPVVDEVKSILKEINENRK